MDGYMSEAKKKETVNPERLELESMDIVGQQKLKLKQIFPEVLTEGGNVDFDKLRLSLGDVIDEGKERYGLNWSGKAECFRIIQTPSTATLKPIKQDSINFDDTNNLFIEGDNLEVLKLMQKPYFGKIKMIYIDPPYNTGKEFIYPDNFTESLATYLTYTGQIDQEGRHFNINTESDGRFHSKWLSMMYPRLYLARNLLKEDGVIFISIDDNELANLQKICDEIFGEENFVALLSVENNPKGRKNSKFISVSNDYCLIYARNKEASHFRENIPKNLKDMSLDENGNYVHNSGKRVLVGENNFNAEVKDLQSDKHYSVYYHSGSSQFIFRKESQVDEIDSRLIDAGYKRYISYRDGRFVENTYSKDKLSALFNEDALDFKEDKIFEKNYSSSIRLKSMLTNRRYEALVDNQKREFNIDVKTTSGGSCLQELFGDFAPLFSSPKSLGLLEILATLFEEKDFTILDFFAGSCTTAHAVLKLNQDDGGSRRFIMIQLPEKCEDSSVPSQAGFKTIADIGKERIRRAIAKLDEHQVDNSPSLFEHVPQIKADRGFRVLKLSDSNFQPWRQDQDSETFQRQLSIHVENVSSKSTPEDLLFEILIKLGFEFSSKVERLEFGSGSVFSVAEGALLICLEKRLSKELVDNIVSAQPIRVVCLDSAFAGNDQLKVNTAETFKAKGITFKTV